MADIYEYRVVSQEVLAHHAIYSAVIERDPPHVQRWLGVIGQDVARGQSVETCGLIQ